MNLRIVPRRQLRRVIDEQTQQIIQLRRVIAAQGVALNELAGSCADWRQLALNTVDAVTANYEGRDK